MTNASKQFEKDVWAFVKALDPSAKVLFNCKIPDKNTSSLRQVDAWINAKFGGHIPISILVSCKNRKRKLDITHIESFAAEVRSTAASTGIIYSSSGFTAPALRKAKSEGLTCCRLFRNEPADIPKSLVIWSYCCMPRLSISLIEPSSRVLNENRIIYWKDLFEMQVDNGKNLLDHIAAQYHQHEKRKVGEILQKDLFPKNWAIEYTFWPDDKPSLKCKIVVCGRWRKYRGKVEAHLLNGSYCFSSNQFQGNMYTPPIDTKHPPGPWWEEIEYEPKTIPDSRMVAIFGGGDVKKLIMEYLGGRLIGSS